MSRPVGVTTIALLFLLVAAYLCVTGGVMLARPGAISMSTGAWLLGGLELAGPYMFLLISAVAAIIGWGLLRMYNWARRLAIVADLRWIRHVDSQRLRGSAGF